MKGDTAISCPQTYPDDLTHLISVAIEDREKFELRMIIEDCKDHFEENGMKTLLMPQNSKQAKDIIKGWGSFCDGSLTLEKFFELASKNVFDLVDAANQSKVRIHTRNVDEFAFNEHRFQDEFRKISKFIHRIWYHKRIWIKLINKLPTWPFFIRDPYFKDATIYRNISRLRYEQERFLVDVRESFYAVSIFQFLGWFIHHKDIHIGLISRICLVLLVSPKETSLYLAFLSSYMFQIHFGFALEAKLLTLILLYYAYFRQNERWIFACRRYKSLFRGDRNLYHHIVLLQALLKPLCRWYDPILYLLQALLCCVNDFEKIAMLWIKPEHLREETVKRFGFFGYHQVVAISILVITSFDLVHRLGLSLKAQAGLMFSNYTLGVATYIVGSRSEIHQFWQAWFLFSFLLANVSGYLGLTMQILGGARLFQMFLRDKQKFKQHLCKLRGRDGVQRALLAPFQSFIVSGEVSDF